MNQHVSVPKYAFIDALRGYAVLFVITSHTGGMFAELPYPVKKLTNFGWHGVQMFFLVSCVTLMMSWKSDQRKNSVSTVAFWARRFFRIAPMYYLAGALYFFVETPPAGFDPWQMLASFLFVNAWHPLLTPTTPDRWIVVPGGWSIGVEFTFYFVFPLIATYVTKMRYAVLLFLFCVIVGGIANNIDTNALLGQYGPIATERFIYFWFPNQAPIFALGLILYFILDRFRWDTASVPAAVLRRWCYPVLGCCAIAMIVLAEQESYRVFALSFAPFQPLPILMIASMLFMVATLVLFLRPDCVFVNRAVCALGKVSFSAYLLHFLVLHQLVARIPSVFNASATGFGAIFTFVLLWLATVPTTFLLSSLTFRFIEDPMIGLGRRLLQGRANAVMAHLPPVRVGE